MILLRVWERSADYFPARPYEGICTLVWSPQSRFWHSTAPLFHQPPQPPGTGSQYPNSNKQTNNLDHQLTGTDGGTDLTVGILGPTSLLSRKETELIKQLKRRVNKDKLHSFKSRFMASCNLILWA